jgi:hypothetical protein
MGLVVICKQVLTMKPRRKGMSSLRKCTAHLPLTLRDMFQVASMQGAHTDVSFSGLLLLLRLTCAVTSF